MSKIKVINDRCPLQGECGRKKCEHKFCERECSYYQGNARPGAEIEDQQQAMEEEWEARMSAPSVLADTSAPSAPQEVEPVVVQGDTGTLVLLPVDKLLSHPDNPRKDLGDLQELADSIKANGVLQNLTVVSLESEAAEWSALSKQYQEHPTEEVRNLMNRITASQPKDSEGLFRVVIGHRRLAAAKLAGLAEVPCVISNMDYREQVRTMLMENIQRSDLSVYEQAQGFQMMLDLGGTVESVAKDTGFSATTIRHRTKLLELDKDKFKKSEARGASLTDYIELEKVDDPEEKNKLLDAIGTADFRSKLNRTLEAQEQKKRMVAFAAAASEFAKKIDKSDYTKMEYVTSYGYYEKKKTVERPADADTVHYYYTENEYNVTIYREKASEDGEDDAAARAEMEKKTAERKRRVADLEAATARAYKLRSEFVKGVSTQIAKKHLGDITAFIILMGVNDSIDISYQDMKNLFGSTFDFDNDEFTLEDAAELTKAPERALLLTAYGIFGDDEDVGYVNSWRPEHEENQGLNDLYLLLEKLGYEISSEEKALRDGTYAMFREGETAAPEEKEAGQNG